MQRWEETDVSVNPKAIAIVPTLVGWLITHGGGLPVSQLFSRKMAVSPLGLTHKLTKLVCTYLNPKYLILRLLIYILCAPIHWPVFHSVFLLSSLHSRWSHILWDPPRMDTNLERSTSDSTQPFIPRTWYHWSISPNTVQYLTPLIPFPLHSPENPVKDGTEGSPICLTPRYKDKTEHQIIHWRRALPEISAQIANTRTQEWRPQQNHVKWFQYKLW